MRVGWGGRGGGVDSRYDGGERSQTENEFCTFLDSGRACSDKISPLRLQRVNVWAARPLTEAASLPPVPAPPVPTLS